MGGWQDVSCWAPFWARKAVVTAQTIPKSQTPMFDRTDSVAAGGVVWQQQQEHCSHRTACSKRSVLHQQPCFVVRLKRGRWWRSRRNAGWKEFLELIRGWRRRERTWADRLRTTGRLAVTRLAVTPSASASGAGESAAVRLRHLASSPPARSAAETGCAAPTPGCLGLVVGPDLQQRRHKA